jgi:GTP-binding protein EngB required for normal cell division
MGLNDIKSRNESMGKKSRGSFLKVNKYENHKMALDLVAHICTESRVIDISPHFEEIHRLVNEMKEKKKAEGFAFSNEDFLSDILEESRKMKEDLLNNVSSSLKIAVTGGYSSGKSSLLNTITNIDDKLPTGIEPVSVVNTYLNCSNSVKDLIIKGENLKNALVSLDEEVLGCIRHSSKSKVYIASVLNKLILDIPVEKTPSLDGVTFIDTPGYNNSKNKNKENDRTDCDTAINAFEEADVIFWCIDIEAGTITQKDMEMIKKAGNKPVVIVFTKIDKKPMEEVKKIINNASALCRKELKYQPKEIIGFSCVDKNNEGYSLIAKTISGFKNQYKTDFRNFYSDKIKDLFKAEIEASENRLKQYEATRQELIKQKDEYHKQRRSLVQDSNDYYEKEPVISIASKSYNGAVPNDVQPQDNWNYWKDRMNYLERERGRLESYGHHSNNQVWELKRQYDQAEFNYHRLYSSSNAGSQYKEQAQAKPVQDQVIRDRESRVEEIERLLEFWKAQMDDYRNSIAIYENVRRKRPHERDYWSERISALTSLYKDAESNCYRLSSNAGFQYKEQAQAKQVQNQIIRDRESPVEGMERDL